MSLKQALVELFQSEPAVRIAILFGSVATGKAGMGSDIDIALLTEQKMSSEVKMEWMERLAVETGRPVDLVDLSDVGEPLLGKILQSGKLLKGGDREYARLLSHHWIEQADFMPYRQRILDERRERWIGRS